jgi:hypothetical protein
VTTLDPTADMQIYSETKDSRQTCLSGLPAEPALLTGDDPPSHLRYPCSP